MKFKHLNVTLFFLCYALKFLSSFFWLIQVPQLDCVPCKSGFELLGISVWFSSQHLLSFVLFPCIRGGQLVIRGQEDW